jgi:hypothetical protein
LGRGPDIRRVQVWGDRRNEDGLRKKGRLQVGLRPHDKVRKLLDWHRKRDIEGKLSTQEHRDIIDALDIPSKSSYRDTVINYRNRMTHGIRPSVDYPELFTDFQSQAGSPFINSFTGKAGGTKYTIVGKKSKPDYLFYELYAALADYMDHVANMLKALKSNSRLA